MTHQEHVAAFAGYAQDIASVLYSRNPDDKLQSFGQMVKERFGDTAWTALVSNANIMIRDTVSNAKDDLKFFGELANNVATAALAYNLSTSFLQFGGFWRFIPFAGPTHLTTVAARGALNPRALLRRAFELDPQLRSRAGDASFAGLVDENSKLHMRYAFTLMTKVDQFVSAVGFVATYESNIARGESHETAISEAQRAVFMTQNATHAKDKPLLWKQSAAIRAAMMFTGDAAKRWNISTYDFVQAVMTPGHRIQKTFYIGLGLGLEVILTKLLRRGTPDDDEDWGEWMADAFASDILSTIPLAGGELVDLYEYVLRKRRGGTTRSVLVAPFKEAYDAVKGFREGDYEKFLWSTVSSLAHLFSTAAHFPIPVTALRRAVGTGNALRKGDFKGAALIQIGRWPDRKPTRRERRIRRRRAA
jgi:hypothetical protein